MSNRAVPTYRAIQPDELAAVAGLMTMSFGNPQDAAGYAERNNYPEQYRVVDVAGELVAAAWFGRLNHWWLGRSLPSAQVLNVGVPPQHRGRGHATTLMRGLLHELHDSGVPTATLFASTAALYRGVGFEVAGQWFWYEVLAEHLPRTTGGYSARQVPLDDLGEIMALYDRVARSRNGALDRDENWWRTRITSSRHGSPEPVAFVIDGPAPDTDPAGWAVLAFDRYEGWKTQITVRDWGCVPGAEPGLYGLLGGFNVLAGKVTWTGPYPDPAIVALPERRFRLDECDEWFLRIVDLPGALAMRPWPTSSRGQLTIRVEDPVCPWNAGDWTLEWAGGKAAVERARPGSAQVTASIRAIAALFSGFLDPATLVRGGLITGLDEPTEALLREAFASPTPWTLEHY